MPFRHILITGGAGFVGSNLALRFKSALEATRVTALDNLLRRGSELNLPRLAAGGVEFLHGDIRCDEDFERVQPFDLLVDCSAEPSVHAGTDGSPRGVLNTNLVGTLHCLEAARRHDAAFLLLSTSRVYPIRRLNELAFVEGATRFEWTDDQIEPGCSSAGIREDFPLDGPRSFYGATKLAGELVLQEYFYNFNLPALVNRCGVLTGPWQMGKVDQGVVTLWVARHHFDQGLRYTGFGGNGKQVRDLLHVDDLADLLLRQMNDLGRWDGRVYNVGGGRPVSTSLVELTELCRRITGRRVPIEPVPETSAVDLRIYLTDAGKVQRDFDWSSARGVEETVVDIHRWIVAHEAALRPVLLGAKTK